MRQLVSTLRGILTPPKAFADRAQEEHFLIQHCRQAAQHRRGALYLSVVCWISYLFWDVAHVLHDPTMFAVWPSVLGLRALGILTCAIALKITLGARFAMDEQHASDTIFIANAICNTAEGLHVLVVPAPFDTVYAMGFFLNVIYSFSILRMLAKGNLRSLLLNGSWTVVVLCLCIRTKTDGSYFGDVHALSTLYLYLNTSVVGFIIGNILEINQRQTYLREMALEASNAALQVRSEEIMQLNNALLQAQNRTRQDAAALVASEEQMRKQAEDQNRNKSMFLASAVHDLRQPLQAISMSLEPSLARLRSGDAPGALNMLNLAQDAAQLMRSQFTSILELCHLETGANTPKITAVRLEAVCSDLCKQLEPVAARAGVALRLEMSGASGLVGTTDPNFLLRILSNLVGNGIKYHRSDETRREVNLRLHSDGSAAVLTVRDNGIGILPSDLAGDRIFRPFIQGTQPMDHGRNGVGLGLSIVRAMLNCLPGHHLTVNSTPGVGSRFTLTLPLAACVSMLATTDASPPGSLDAQALRGLFVLLVEDDALVRMATTEWLALQGCACLAFDSHEQFRRGLSHLERLPDLVVSDFNLNDGSTALDVKASLEAEDMDVPMMVISGEIHDLARHPRLADCVVLNKPLSPQDLLTALLRYQPAASRAVHAPGV